MYGIRGGHLLDVDNGNGKSWLSSFSLPSCCLRGEGIWRWISSQFWSLVFGQESVLARNNPIYKSYWNGLLYDPPCKGQFPSQSPSRFPCLIHHCTQLLWTRGKAIWQKWVTPSVSTPQIPSPHPPSYSPTLFELLVSPPAAEPSTRLIVETCYLPFYYYGQWSGATSI
jgi:hypothetical protein